jgi:hypothetical protein
MTWLRKIGYITAGAAIGLYLNITDTNIGNKQRKI